MSDIPGAADFLRQVNTNRLFDAWRAMDEATKMIHDALLDGCDHQKVRLIVRKAESAVSKLRATELALAGVPEKTDETTPIS